METVVRQEKNKPLHPQWKLLYTTSRNTTTTVPDLSQHDDTLLRGPIGDDIEHPRPVAPSDPVVHLCILPYVSVQGPDHSHLRPELPGLGHSELIESCREII